MKLALKLRTSIKTQVATFLIVFAAYIAFTEKATILLSHCFVTVLAATILDTIFTYYKERTFKISESAIISGLIIGFVLADTDRWWEFCIAALIAIGAKYILRYNNRHVFNPAALGIFITALLLGSQTQWHGTFLWYILIPFGLYFSYKINKLEVLAGYGITSLLLFGGQALLQHVSLLQIIGYFSYFYIFIMLIEPKTTPVRQRGKLIFGAGVAVTIFILSQFNISFDVELATLLLFNITVIWLNKLPERRTI